jgi:hypothetical protein
MILVLFSLIRLHLAAIFCCLDFGHGHFVLDATVVVHVPFGRSTLSVGVVCLEVSL